MNLPAAPPAADAQLARLLACMAHEAAAGSPCGPAFAASLALALHLHMQRHMQLHMHLGMDTDMHLGMDTGMHLRKELPAPRRPAPAAAPRPEPERCFGSAVRLRLAEHVRAHLSDKVSLVELAALAGLSPHYFLQVFRNSFGMTPHRYLLHARVERAKQMLADEQASISEIGLALGFADQSHFTATFHRLSGSTPSHWRQLRR